MLWELFRTWLAAWAALFSIFVVGLGGALLCVAFELATGPWAAFQVEDMLRLAILGLSLPVAWFAFGIPLATRQARSGSACGAWRP